MGLVPDQGAVQQFVAAGLYPPFHERVHARYPDAAEHRLDSGASEDLVEQLGELPVPVADEDRARQPASSRSMTRFFAACVTQDAVGCAVAPSTLILRVACSITANTYSLAPDRVIVSKKSQANSASACERRNAPRWWRCVRVPGRSRRPAGSPRRWRRRLSRPTRAVRRARVYIPTLGCRAPAAAPGCGSSVRCAAVPDAWAATVRRGGARPGRGVSAARCPA